VDVFYSDGSITRRFEFKSVANIPPSEFSGQYLEDLRSATSIDEIVWVFDGDKLRQNYTDAEFRNIMKMNIESLLSNLSQSELDTFLNKFTDPGEPTLLFNELVDLLVDKTMNLKP
jgi:hypothetical protein